MKCLLLPSLLFAAFGHPLLAADRAPAFPLKVSEHCRHLVDQQNRPFFVMGDTPWFLQKLPLEDVRRVMNNRLAKGFNTLFLEFLDDSHLPSRDAHGSVSFNPERDITKPVEAYWRDVLDARSTREAAHILRLMGTIPWWKLVPDVKHEFVTAGFGEWKKADYATAALADDGGCAVVYRPSARTFTMELAKLKTQVAARWFNPASGQFQGVAGSPFANSGSRELTPPGKNAEGDSDWVLVLEAK